MSNNLVRTSVQLRSDCLEQIDQLCVEIGSTRSVVIRNAVEQFVARSPLSHENPKRVAMLREFTQVALDVLVREQVPERREEILATVQDRMERYHAQG